MIRVLIIEDHDIVREGMEHLLSQKKGFQVISTALTGKEGIKLAREKTPDVIVLDFQLPDINGLEVLHKLKQYESKIKILILTAQSSEEIAIQLLEAGAAGFLSKSCGYSELIKAIEAIHLGHRYISPDMASKLALRKTSTKNQSIFQELSTREMEITLLIASGLNPETIAKRLSLSKKTIHSYRYRIFEKLGVQSDLELLRLSLQHKLIELDQNSKFQED